jgi:hypothetical protein
MNKLLEKWKNLEIKNFDNNSELKRRLEVHCLNEYEENAIIDDEHLLMEFNYLKDSNLLSKLF